MVFFSCLSILFKILGSYTCIYWLQNNYNTVHLNNLYGMQFLICCISQFAFDESNTVTLLVITILLQTESVLVKVIEVWYRQSYYNEPYLFYSNTLSFWQISFPDLEDYDSDQAWPVIIDNFVEWMKDNKQS